MSLRPAAAVLAGALILVPSIRAGRDATPMLGPPASRASAAHPLHASSLPSHVDSSSFVFEGEETTTPQREAPAPVTAFGSGAKTGFFPSDTPRELVISFDDGPDLKFTPLVLDELARRGLKAIFFVTGDRVIGDRPEDAARRELLGRIAAHGHMVANHTMTHVNLCRSPERIDAEIDQNSEVIMQATGVRPLLFRAPYGARCKALENALAARQLVSVGWNLDPQDWRKPTSEEILTYLQAKLSRLAGRGILLLHDTHPASVFALGPLLDWIARENRTAVSEGRPPIVLRDYAVFLPARPMPQTGLATVVGSIVGDVMAGMRPKVAADALSALR